ncbi:nitroreductase family protein [Tichowtungia aerotolerans]|uniref:Nitroreductase domain-containing protein n=1 Tax=Tichowtungia aerotolerans TaxID=2697043 RepID=A0A6P1MGH3_9BACT|nr:nitroreductase family protein [Tichowtungia aerotolerans]QHI70185.1 hypothetical protein GT409_12290 [Tichowtungia aerotolerans]
MIKELYKKIVPLRIQQRFRFEKGLVHVFFSDYLRYRKYACIDPYEARNIKAFDSMLVMEAHKIEKAFSLPNPRPGFGVSAIRGLMKLLNDYKNKGYDCNSLAYKKVQSVLGEYIRFHERVEYDLGPLKEEVRHYADFDCDIGGYNEVAAEEWLRNARGNFEECALSRSSVRTYSSIPVPEETIKDVVRIARKTPSVCNRQAWHTYIVKSPEVKGKLMELQTGCRGFGDTADFMAVITTNLRSFVGPSERNQAYIDGGLYAMSFLYALHYKGIGACPLHWMVPPERSEKLRSLLNIGASENIIMVISAGGIPPLLRTAKSVRHKVDSQITFV